MRIKRKTRRNIRNTCPFPLDIGFVFEMRSAFQELGNEVKVVKANDIQQLFAVLSPDFCVMETRDAPE